MKEKILITGAHGQLGNELQVISKQYPQHDFIYADIDSLDITQEKELSDFFNQNKINFIINCAAYTAVDKAEDEKELCFKINKEAVYNLAKISQLHQIKLIHISTDYVFDGTAHLPYKEEDPTNPMSVYGRSKMEGENILLKTNPEALIIRTSWLYSSFGNNFVKTMIKLGKERESLTVIFDQIGSPTYAADLAVAIMSIIDSKKISAGIYHFSNEGVCSWYDFAVAIHQHSKINHCQVIPIESKDFPTKAHRPHYSILNKAKIKDTYQLKIAHWEDGLKRCIEKLNITD